MRTQRAFEVLNCSHFRGANGGETIRLTFKDIHLRNADFVILYYIPHMLLYSVHPLSKSTLFFINDECVLINLYKMDYDLCIMLYIESRFLYSLNMVTTRDISILM